MKRLSLLLLLAASLAACAHQPLPPGQASAPAGHPSQALSTLFPVALKAGVALETKNLLTWHPDVLPYLRQWLDALCATLVSPTDTRGLQLVLVATLDTITMPPTMHNILEEFIPVLVALVPLAMQAAEVVPQFDTMIIVVTDVCKWIEAAMPPVVALKP